MHRPFRPSIFHMYYWIMQQINIFILTRDGKSNNYLFLTYNGMLPEEIKGRSCTPWKCSAGISPLLLHLRLEVFCVYLYKFQTKSCRRNSSQTSARWQWAATSLLQIGDVHGKGRHQHRQMPDTHTFMCGATARSKDQSRVFGVSSSQLVLSRWHLSKRCNWGEGKGKEEQCVGRAFHQFNRNNEVKAQQTCCLCL